MTESSTSLVYFSYTSGNYVYFASATASALSAGTAALSFTRTEIKIANITNVTLTGQKKSSNQNCKFSFTTDQPGTYTIIIEEGDNSTTDTIIVDKAGTITKNNYYKTKTSNSKIIITIEGVNASVTEEFSRSSNA